MKAERFIVLVVACGLALGPERTAAQGRTTIAVDATLGAGFGKGGEFYNRAQQSGRIAVSVRRSRSTQVGLFGEVALDAVLPSGDLLVCYQSPRGGCLQRFPDFWGPTLTGGLIAQRIDRFEARLGVGGGALSSGGSRVGAAVSQLDVAFFPLSHIGLITGTRWIVVPRYRGDRLSVLPWAIGLRLR
jgi:hypothetical protein